MLTMKAYMKFGLTQDPFTGDVTKADDVYLTDETRFISEFLYQTAKIGGLTWRIGKRQDDNPPLCDGSHSSGRTENQNHNAALDRQGASYDKRNLRRNHSRLLDGKTAPDA